MRWGWVWLIEREIIKSLQLLIVGGWGLLIKKENRRAMNGEWKIMSVAAEMGRRKWTQQHQKASESELQRSFTLSLIASAAGDRCTGVLLLINSFHCIHDRCSFLRTQFSWKQQEKIMYLLGTVKTSLKWLPSSTGRDTLYAWQSQRGCKDENRQTGKTQRPFGEWSRCCFSSHLQHSAQVYLEIFNVSNRSNLGLTRQKPPSDWL